MIQNNSEIFELYKGISVLEGCFILVNYNKGPSQFILHIGKTPINQIKDIKIKVLTGNLEGFRNQLAKNTQMIKDFLENHVILSNHELLINELWKNYQKISF